MLKLKKFFLSLSLISVFLLSFSPSLFAADNLTITTYYPSPYGVYNEIRSTRMAIGADYVDNTQYCWTGSCTNAIATTTNLVVEGNVGIGTTSPGQLFEAASGSNKFDFVAAGPYITVTDGTVINGFGTANGNQGWLGNVSNNNLNFRTNNTVRMTIDTSGNVGIGTTSPSYPLHIASTVSSSVTGYGYLNQLGSTGYNAGSYTLPTSLYAAGKIVATGDFDAVSDERLKDFRNFINPKVALSAVLKLKPLQFTWKPKVSSDQMVKAGFFAQQVARAIPESVTVMRGEHLSDEHTLNYDMLTTYSLAAIQGIAGALDIQNAIGASPTLQSSYQGRVLPAMVVDKSGNVGIGTTNPTTALQVNGTVTATAFSGSGTAVAWVNFDTNGSIRASYNVSSVTHNSAGVYTINFTKAMSDTNYAVIATVGMGIGDCSRTVEVSSYSVSSCMIETGVRDGGNTHIDVTYGNVVVFR